MFKNYLLVALWNLKRNKNTAINIFSLALGFGCSILIFALIKTIFHPFAYSFIDEYFSGSHASEQQAGELFNVFSILSIIISCLGLFGLFAFVKQQRNKEIGVRKILVASVTSTSNMLSKYCLKPVTVAEPREKFSK
jgi:uncharacterized BrkB/YihY/UPF0761 family membrane protein